MITLEKICAVLNEAFENDPIAMQSLLCAQTPVNQALADHPYIQVRKFKAGIQEGYAMTFIGLLNGLVAEDEGRFIATQWSDEVDEFENRTMLGFCIVTAEDCMPD